MGTEAAVRRTGGLAVSVLGAVAVVAVTELPTARPLDRPSADVHAEYVKFPSGRDTITAYLAYPERKDRAPVVIVIHEIFGMSDFIRQTTEQLAREGFVAIAPDLLSRRGGTPSSSDDARKLIAGLEPDTVTKDLDATAAYAKGLKAARADRVGVIGFCWGGGQSFRYATNNPSLRAFVVCYGPGPDALSIARIRTPLLGVYGENDARINTTLPNIADRLKGMGKSFTYRVYPGTGHGFLKPGRQGSDGPQVDKAWGDILDFFKQKLDTKNVNGKQ